MQWLAINTITLQVPPVLVAKTLGKQPYKMIFEVIAHRVAELFGVSVFEYLYQSFVRYEGFE